MDLTLIFTKVNCMVLDTHKNEVLRGVRKSDGLYLIPSNPKHEYENLARAPADLQTWHGRLGHVSYPSIINMAKKNMAIGMPTDLSTMPPICEQCIMGKQMKWPVPRMHEGRRSTRLLDLVFSDITGPEDVPASGKVYVLNFIDNYSRQTWSYLLAKKSDALATFKEWWSQAECQAERTVKSFVTDNGGEYTVAQKTVPMFEQFWLYASYYWQ
jgi:GAG-pre-integrase domain/Integrase core domain